MKLGTSLQKNFLKVIATGLLGVHLLGTHLLASAAEPPVIRWLVQDLGPHFSYVGGRAPQSPAELGNGELDGFLRQLIAQLPQYRHEFVELSLQRYEALLRQGETLCSVLHKRRPERLADRYFTPMFPSLGSRQLQLVVPRDRLGQFHALGAPVSVAKLVQIGGLHGLVARERSFGPTLDALLKEGQGKGLQTIAAARSTTVLAMLRAGRVDYTLEYADTVKSFLQTEAKAPGAELVLLPIAEVEERDIAHASCTRSAAGRERIEAIDAAVRRMARDPQREVWLRAWLGDRLAVAERGRLNRFLDERARHGPQLE